MSQKLVKEGVYVLYFKGEVVYIGQSNNLYQRIGEHVKEGIKEFDSFDVYETPDRKRLEGFLISAFHPKYNIAEGKCPFVDSANNDLFMQNKIDECISTYENGRKTISVGEVADIFDEYPKTVLYAIREHMNEIPAWKHIDDLEWKIDYSWFLKNSDKLKEWINVYSDEVIYGFQDNISKRKDGRYQWRFKRNGHVYYGYSRDYSEAKKALIEKQKEISQKGES